MLIASITHICPFSKSKTYIKSDRVNLVALASPVDCLLKYHDFYVSMFKNNDFNSLIRL